MSDPDPKVVKQVLAELRHHNKDTRRTAVMKLGMMGGDEAVRMLMLIVTDNTEDLIVRGRAALMLGKMGDVRAVGPLIRALDAPGYQTPLYAAQSLGQLGDPRAIPPLVRMLRTDHDRFRQAALVSLAKLGYNPEAPVLEPEAEGEA